MKHLAAILRQVFMTLAAILIITGFAITLAEALPYLFCKESYDTFFGASDPMGSRRLYALLHIAPAIVALMIGPFQLSASMREFAPRLHRINGWTYVSCVAISGTASLILAPHTQGGAYNGLGLGILAVLWLIATGMALSAVIRGKYQQHQDWMLRSYVLTCCGVIFRIQLVILEGVLNWQFEDAYALAAWACWLPTLIILEIWIRTRPAFDDGRNPR